MCFRLYHRHDSLFLFFFIFWNNLSATYAFHQYEKDDRAQLIDLNKT